jgi:hypothetical protein
MTFDVRQKEQYYKHLNFSLFFDSLLILSANIESTTCDSFFAIAQRNVRMLIGVA